MAYASLADYNGEIGITFFPKPWAELKDKLQDGAVTALRGKIKNDSFKNRFAFYAETMPDLDRLKGKYADGEADAAAVTESAAAMDDTATDGGRSAPPRTSPAAPCREVHIQLSAGAAEQEETLYPLRDLLFAANVTESGGGNGIVMDDAVMEGDVMDDDTVRG